MQATIKAPIFIVGCPRSGTTLLQQMLDAHLKVAIAPETHFIREFWLNKDSYGDLREDGNYARLIDDLNAMPVFAEMGLDADNFSQAAGHLERNYGAVFSLLLQQFASNKKAQIVGEKTPNHLLYMPILQQMFPDARFVHIVRDPRAVVNSWRTVPWSTGSLVGDAEVWRRYLATARVIPASKLPLYTLKYEQLVLHPETSLRSLCNFLNLDYQSTMLNYHSTDSQTVNIQREPWKKNATKPISKKLLYRWQSDLQPDMIAQIEAVAWSEMKHLDYRPQTPAWQRMVIATQLKAQALTSLIKKCLSRNFQHDNETEIES